MSGQSVSDLAAIVLDGSQQLEREMVGGKAWGINHMRARGLPVPPAFVFPVANTEAYAAAGDTLPEGLPADLRRGIAMIEEHLGRTFGGGEKPLLVSVRSGAASSMPGMMDTLLNLGMTPDVEQAIAAETGDAEFAADLNRRFVEQFAHIVGGAPPSDPWEQLEAATAAVFASWSSRRSVDYRKHHDLGELRGTAATVQAMVFGNLDDTSGTGVLFSRNPLTGDRAPLGEWLPRAQGEEVVSGTSDPFPLSHLAEALPDAHTALMDAANALEQEAADVQDIEFTVQSGRLWLLQTRNAKRSPEASVRFAVAFAKEGLIDHEAALRRVAPAALEGLLKPGLDPEAAAGAELLASGEPACPGVAYGVVVGDADEAEERADEDESVVLARPTTDPGDLHGMIAAEAIVTEMGGSTSHAAVVSRELGRPCIVGCGSGVLGPLAGREVTVDGAAGKVYAGRVPERPAGSKDDPDLVALREWAIEHPDAGKPIAVLLD